MFTVGKTYHGFKLLEETSIEELQALGRIFVHEKSGARLLHLETEDNNKVFSIGFRTPPADSTGVPHILEHSVLAGSKKYTTKEPFMDMMRSSLRTFINAMTFADKTIYPVASRNEKDFFNLMDVYLDAVFYPRIYEIPEIFMQEGWHYELFDKSDDIVYKGVVYNEMKGAYSAPETILGQAIAKSLLPDTCYSFSSGGDPDVIPSLTRKDFLEFHRKLYHPSNSYIFLYGDGDINKQLAHIHENYLSHFQTMEVDSEIAKQTPFTERTELVDYYNISADDNDENKTYLSLNFLIGESSDFETRLANVIVTHLLIKSEAAPLKKALRDAGIGEDVFSVTEDGRESIIGFVAKNTSVQKKDEFLNVITNTLKELVATGIDKDLVKASINVVDYRLREAAGFATKGIIYKIVAMEGWLYDQNPIESLQYASVIKALREKANEGYFETFIKEKFLNNNHSSLVIVEPKKGLAAAKEAALKEKLRQYKASLSEAELEQLIAENNKLKSLQSADDSPEAKATIPKLSLSDVEAEAEIIPQKVFGESSYTLLYHDIFTGNIAYLDLYFDISSIEEELIPYVNILAALLTNVDTEYKTYGDLSNAIFANTGGIQLTPNVLIKDDKARTLLPKLSVGGKALGDNVDALIELMAEVMFHSKFEDAARIKELLLRLKSRLEMGFSFSGNAVVANRVRSYYSKGGSYQEKLKGLDFYWFISDLATDFDEKKHEIQANLSKLYRKIFNTNNLIVSFTGEENDLARIRGKLSIITDKLSSDALIPREFDFKPQAKNEGILSNYNVQYVAKGYNYKDLGFDYQGSLVVAGTILNTDYLHNRVRAQGGAYGVGVNIDYSGNMAVSSYRDPNLKETLNVYDDIADYLANLNLSEEEMTQYIIGTIAWLNPALTPYRRGQMQTIRYITGLTQAKIQKIRDEVLSASLDAIKNTATLFAAVMERNNLCVLGNEMKINSETALFQTLIKLSK